ncbi:MAG TPA: CYTH domain-containing protein [Devosiaceae bacterium]|jgi:adenylate cyclase
MAIEIERKFLVRDPSWQTAVTDRITIRQGYLATGHNATVRVRIGNERATLTIKSGGVGMARAEYEYEIPVGDAGQMLDTLALRPLIEKTRHRLRVAGHLWEIDVFAGDNAGLIVAEIELESPDEVFAEPQWLGAEITGDARYYNSSLIEHPFGSWAKD